MLSQAEPRIAAPWYAPAAPRISSAARILKWDPLLICVAGYVLTAVGRIHQLFPALQTLRPVILTGLFAIVLYVLDPQPVRRLSRAMLPASKWLLALLAWMMLTVPGALVASTSFTLVFD